MSASRVPYFERRAAAYLDDSGKGLWRLARAAEWRALRPLLSLSTGLKILDAGCGAGFYSRLMRGAADVRVRGLDSSPAMIAAYRAQGFEGEIGTIESHRTVRRYDRVLLAGVLEFVPRPEDAVRNLAALLAPGGRIVCLVPKTGLAGAGYRLVHRLWGCPAFVREPERYFQLARGHGLEPSEFASATAMSCVFVLRPTGRRRDESRRKLIPRRGLPGRAPEREARRPY